jgi:hypothetical protein
MHILLSTSNAQFRVPLKFSHTLSLHELFTTSFSKSVTSTRAQVSNCPQISLHPTQPYVPFTISQLTCHFCNPLSLAPFVDCVLRLAIFGSFALTYSCAKLAQTFLCVLKCAFWQSLSQYDTLWHLRHCFRVLGDLPHWAHCGVGGAVDDEASEVVLVGSEVELLGPESVALDSVGSVMISDVCVYVIL